MRTLKFRIEEQGVTFIDSQTQQEQFMFFEELSKPVILGGKPGIMLKDGRMALVEYEEELEYTALIKAIFDNRGE